MLATERVLTAQIRERTPRPNMLLSARRPVVVPFLWWRALPSESQARLLALAKASDVALEIL